MTDCDRCGYRPRRKDCVSIEVTDPQDGADKTVVHVICYNCGAEWVE